LRLDKARIAPLTPSELNDEQKDALITVTNKSGKTLNIFATFARRPAALKSFLKWGNYILQETDLSPREREILILRTGHRCDSGYEFHQHTRIGLRSGLSEEDILALRQDVAEGRWSKREVLLIKAADELFEDSFVSTVTWDALAQTYSEAQLMDIVMVIGQYTQVSMLLNSFGVQIEG